MTKRQRQYFDCGSAWVSYSPLEGRKVFSMAIELDHIIKADILKVAVKDMKKRLPNFFVNIKRTKFRDYYVCTESTDIVEVAPGYPPKTVPLFDDKKPLFRILYKKNKVFIEFDHALTDGNGMIMFFRSLITHYYELLGIKIEKYAYIHSVGEHEKDNEYIDNYLKCKINEKVPMELLKDPENTVQIDYGKYQENCFYTGIGFKTEDIVEIAKKYSISVTEYFAAIILYAFYLELHPQEGSRLCINIPIDLRYVTGNLSIRNSSDTITIGLIPSSRHDATFYEFITSLRGQIKERTQKRILMQRIKKSILITQNPLFRCLPQPLKLSIYTKNYYRLHGGSVTSFSNMGLVVYPDELSEHIKSEYVTALTNVREGQVAFYCISTRSECVLTASHGTKETPIIDRIRKLLELDDINYELKKLY